MFDNCAWLLCSHMQMMVGIRAVKSLLCEADVQNIFLDDPGQSFYPCFMRAAWLKGWHCQTVFGGFWQPWKS